MGARHGSWCPTIRTPPLRPSSISTRRAFASLAVPATQHPAEVSPARCTRCGWLSAPEQKLRPVQELRLPSRDACAERASRGVLRAGPGRVNTSRGTGGGGGGCRARGWGGRCSGESRSFKGDCRHLRPALSRRRWRTSSRIVFALSPTCSDPVLRVSLGYWRAAQSCSPPAMI